VIGGGETGDSGAAWAFSLFVSHGRCSPLRGFRDISKSDFRQAMKTMHELLIVHSEGQRVAWLLQRSYKPPKRCAEAHWVGTLAFRCYLLRLLAALKSVSLAHVTGLAPSDSAADHICSFSSSVIGISILAVLRSLGSLGGLPVRLFSMPLNIMVKSLAS